MQVKPHTPSPSLIDLLGPQLAAVNACLIEKIQSSVPLIPEIAGYLISLGGKRLRPLLTLAAAEVCGYTGDRHVQLATCVEFIHTATLLHDDVVDKSDMRRGMASANANWGNQTSVLVGDFLFSRAFELMVTEGFVPILAILSKASSTIVEGEILQLYSNSDMTDESYLKMIEAKTACLFEAATRVGAVVAGASEELEDRLGEFGRLLGLAFQLVDDVLDYTGKEAGDDFKESKVTYPVLFALREGSEPEFWTKGLGDPTKFSYAVELLKRDGAFVKTRELAAVFARQAITCLDPLPSSFLKTALQDLALHSINREE